MPDFIKEKMKGKEDKDEEKDEEEDDKEDDKEEKKDEKKEAASKDEDDDTCKKCGEGPCKCDEDEEDKDKDDKKEEKKASKKMANVLGIERHEVLAMLATAGTDLVLDVVEEMILDKKSVKKAVKQARKEAAQQGITAPGAEAQDRVAVDGDLLEEVGEGTKTFGSDDFHVGDPIGGDNANTLGGPIGTAFASEDDVRSHIFRSLKIAETEIELGLIEETDKFERASSLEKESAQELDAREETLVRVKKTAGRTSSKKVAGRVPSLKSANFTTQSSTVVSSEELDDSSLFM
jgi:hypothetical protein